MNKESPALRSGLSLALTGGVVALSWAASVWWKQRQQQQSSTKADEGSAESPPGAPPPKERSAPIAEVSLDADGMNYSQQEDRIRTPGSITIVHGSVTGTALKLAEDLHKQLREQFPDRRLAQVSRLDEWDWWDELLTTETDEISSSAKAKAIPVLIILLPTYTGGTWPPVAAPLQTALDEISSDWRVPASALRGQLQVAILGIGSSAYNDGSMGQPARQAVRSFQKLGAKLLVRLAVADDAVGNNVQETYTSWSTKLHAILEKNAGGKAKGKHADKKHSCEDDNCCSKEEKEKTDETDEMDETPVQDWDLDEEDEAREPDVLDLEDMGDALVTTNDEAQSDEPREMVTPSQAKALKKEGYQLIGTHSAVKLCRWTKHQLRGRGGCYKVCLATLVCGAWLIVYLSHPFPIRSAHFLRDYFLSMHGDNTFLSVCQQGRSDEVCDTFRMLIKFPPLTFPARSTL